MGYRAKFRFFFKQPNIVKNLRQSLSMHIAQLFKLNFGTLSLSNVTLGYAKGT